MRKSTRKKVLLCVWALAYIIWEMYKNIWHSREVVLQYPSKMVKSYARWCIKIRKKSFVPEFFCYKLNYSYRILNAIFNKLNVGKETYTKLLNLHPHKQLPVHHFPLYIGMCLNVVYPLVLISKRVPRQAALMNVLPSVMKKKEMQRNY